MSNNSIKADVLVVGFGKGGKIVAARMGQLGKRVVLVERSPRMYGGTCPNVGCVPTKALLHQSGKRGPHEQPQQWYASSVGEVQALTALLRAGNFDALNGADTVTLVTGHATFLDPHTVGVGDGADQLTISADTILINTGSEPVIPDIPGLRESKHVLTSADLIETSDLPKRLAIVGGGYLGIEFAAIYRRFGSEVTVFESGARILAREDDDVVAVAEKILRDEGVTILPEARVTRVTDVDTGGANLDYESGGRGSDLGVDAVLVATGRAPATRGLGLAAAGVATTESGAIAVDEHLRTSRPHIYALGDVNGGPQFTYISLDDSRIVLDQLLGDGRRSTADRVAVPRTVFMTPPFATVGLTEKQAAAAGRRLRIASQPVAEIIAMPRAYAVEETRGVMKFVVDADTDQILGAALISIDAQEIINTVALAMRHGVTASELRDGIYTHPSSTEALNDVLGVDVHTQR